MPTARKITSIMPAHKWSTTPTPCHPLPGSQPRLPGPTLLFVLAPASILFTHIQTSGAGGVQKGPLTSERRGRKGTGRIQCPTVACSHCHLGFSLPPARSCSNTHATLSHKELFHSPDSRECLPWFPERQMPVQLLPLGHLFRSKGSSHPT